MKNFVLTVFCILVSLTFGSCNHPSAEKHLTDRTSKNQNTEKVALPDHNLTGKPKQLTDLANFIAGMPIDSSSQMYTYSLSSAWKSYSEESATVWNKFKKESDNISNWRTKNIPLSEQPYQTLFYPFGGPDYLFANIFFPKATNYILIGLENPGSVPQIDSSNKDSLNRILNLYKKAIEDVIQLSFFRTLDMKSDLTSKAIDGTAPIIMLFLARSGKEVYDVIPRNIDDEGNMAPVTGKKKYNAIQIDFKNPGDTSLRHVYYVSVNLADGNLLKNKGILTYLKNLDSKSISMIKSATYLMHKSYFSIIRNTVLNKSILILQDDSGISYKFYDQTQWDISLFGKYTKPIPMFIDHYEADLFAAYKNVSNPINFRYGYNLESNILLALKKQ